jgi:hypothetical protein
MLLYHNERNTGSHTNFLRHAVSEIQTRVSLNTFPDILSPAGKP